VIRLVLSPVHLTLLCLYPLHVSGVKRPSSGGTTLAVLGVSCVHLELLAGCKLWKNLKSAKSYKCTQLTLKIASVVSPEDGCLMPDTCRGSRHNKVIVKVKEY
jgi:hypothetical protein